MKLNPFTVFAAAIFAAGSCLAADALPLTQGGKATASIILDCKVKEKCPIEFGAKELQMWLEKITGAKLEIKASPDDSMARIYIGTPQLSPKIKEISNRYSADLKQIGDTDGFAIRQNGNDIYIFGNTPKGALNGVYQFLNDNTDLIFVRPLEAENGFGTIYGKKPDLSASKTDLLKVPAFPKYRYFAGHTDLEKLWQTRLMNRMNVVYAYTKDDSIWRSWGMNFIGGRHSINLILPIEKYTKSNPEFYPLKKGKRTWNLRFDTFLCWTNPDALKAFTEHFLQDIEKGIAQGVTEFDLPHGDMDNTCECKICTADVVVDGKVVAAYADSIGKNKDIPRHMSNFNSTRYYLFMNEVAKAVKAKYPNVRLRGMAYWTTRIPPGVPLEDNIDIVWCPYKKTLRLPITAPEQKTDRYNYPDTFDTWKKRNRGAFYLYEYHLCTQPALIALPVGDTVATDLKFYRKNHVTGVYFDSNGWDNDTEINDYGTRWPRSATFDASAIEHWVISRLMWDPNLDPEQLRDEFCKRAYRDAAKEMRAYFRLLHDSWDKNRLFLSWDAGTKMYIRYVVAVGKGKQAEDLLLSAMNKASHPGSKELIKRQLDVFQKAVAPERNW